MEIAAEAILVVDSSKFGHANGVLVATLDRFSTVITDTGASEEFVAGLRRAVRESSWSSQRRTLRQKMPKPAPMAVAGT